MPVEPLYPAYLPTRPDGFSATIDVPPFDCEEPGTRADRSKSSILASGAVVEDITPRIGSEIRGVQLSQLTGSGLDEVALLAAERGVLVFVSAYGGVDVAGSGLMVQLERSRL
jgi:sulfonate dioxygenase